MACCGAPKNVGENKIRLLNKLVDSLTLQLKRAPFHAMADAITLAISEMYPQTVLTELYVLGEDSHLSLMSLFPAIDLQEYPSHTRLEGALAQVVRTRESIIMKADETHVGRGYLSGMCVPWIQQGAVEGLLLLSTRQKNAYDPDDLRFLQLLASIANVFSLATKVSSEIRKNRRMSQLPEHLLRSSLVTQKYQSSSREPSDLQESRIIE